MVHQIKYTCERNKDTTKELQTESILDKLLNITISFTEELRQYSVWLRAGRPGDRGSIPGGGKGFLL
jgi:hypothetical protein